jgi:hypothetical protein
LVVGVVVAGVGQYRLQSGCEGWVKAERKYNR